MPLCSFFVIFDMSYDDVMPCVVFAYVFCWEIMHLCMKQQKSHFSSAVAVKSEKKDCFVPSDTKNNNNTTQQYNRKHSLCTTNPFFYAHWRSDWWDIFWMWMNELGEWLDVERLGESGYIIST